MIISHKKNCQVFKFIWLFGAEQTVALLPEQFSGLAGLLETAHFVLVSNRLIRPGPSVAWQPRTCLAATPTARREAGYLPGALLRNEGWVSNLFRNLIPKNPFM